MRVLAPIDGLSRADWLALRRMGLGSSDAAALAGFDRFRSPLVVYLDKIGELDDGQETDAMHWGNRLEQAIADEFAERTGFEVVKPTEMYQHDDHDWMLASPDRFLIEPGQDAPESALEVKTSRLTDDFDEAPTDRVLIQVAHQLAVLGWDRAYVAVLLNGREYKQWEVDRDDDLIEHLLAIEAEFWQRVQDRNPPPADGHPATGDALKRLYRIAEPGSKVDLPEEARDLVAQLRGAKARLVQADQDVDELQNLLKAMIGEHVVGEIDGTPLLRWSPVTQKRLDVDALKADHPELVEEYTRPSTHRRFTLAKEAA